MSTRVGHDIQQTRRTVAEIAINVNPSKLEFVPGDSRRYGSVGDGVANDTTAIQEMFDVCVEAEIDGYISAGTYLVTLGSISVDTPFVNKSFPNIYTAGHNAVKFTNATDIDAPFISITNGTAVSGVFAGWLGGSIGGMTFERVTGSGIKVNQCGLNIGGMWGTTFGYIAGISLGGSTVRIEQNLFGGSNPDPYNVLACYFDAVDGNGNGDYAFNNDNFVGWTGCKIKLLRAILCTAGGYHGFGAANIVEIASIGSCSGWAFDDDLSAAGGAGSRFTLIAAELDNCANVIKADRLTDSIFTGRIVHRFQTNPNVTANYWPRIGVSLGSNSSQDIDFKLTARVEVGGALVDLGEFVDFNLSGNVNQIVMSLNLLNNAGFSFTDSDFYTNLLGSARVLYTVDNEVMIDSLFKVGGFMRAAVAEQIENGGFSGAGNYIDYDTIIKDDQNNFDTTNDEYIVRAAGLYRVRAQITLSLTAGDRVRIGVEVAGTMGVSATHYCAATGVGTYDVEGYLVLSAGQAVKISADQNSGGAVTLTTTIAANENYFFVEPA